MSLLRVGASCTGVESARFSTDGAPAGSVVEVEGDHHRTSRAHGAEAA
ncbi:hypothetical protein [Microbacterium sp. zg.Y909]|nr:hypothetical protein [Microbacterium sp. zg.Y909]MCR2827484.1 hypothetical protein [Microbacterium sp. zg.Y909]